MRKRNNKSNNINGLMAMDAFSNPMSRMGANTTNQMEGTSYPITRLTRNYNLMNSLYRSHWIASRIIDTIPEDMTKNWLKINTELPPKQLDKYYRMERMTRIKASLTQGLKWGSLYGGAACIMLIDGQQDMLEEPLDLDSVMPDSFKGLMVVDRWSGISPGPTLITDINSPERGYPEYYSVTNDADKEIAQIHHSRILRFQGKELPLIEKQAEMYWGASKIEDVFDELRKRDNTSYNIAGLMFLTNLRVLQMDGLEQILGTGNKKAQQSMYNTIQSQNALMNNFGMYVMGKEDKMTNYQYSFSGVSEVYESFMLDVSGASQIPMTKLFGRSPAGMNATGEHDLRNYYNLIEQKQENDLRPQYEKLMPLLAMSAWGTIPDDLDMDFNPIQTPSEEETANIVKNQVGAIVEAYQNDLITQKSAVKELQQMSQTTSMFTNITNENVEAASDDYQGNSIAGMGGLEGLQDLMPDENDDNNNTTPKKSNKGGASSPNKSDLDKKEDKDKKDKDKKDKDKKDKDKKGKWVDAYQFEGETIPGHYKGK